MGTSRKTFKLVLPAMLVMFAAHIASADKRDAAVDLRELLLTRYDIAAEDKTDTHAPRVLRSLLTILDHALSPQFVRQLKSFRSFLAYRGHDDHFDVAGFHPEARAISIGGQATYLPASATSGSDIALIAALAHEIGHVFVFDRVSPLELQQISRRYGGWENVFHGRDPRDLFSPMFFTAHPTYASQKDDSRSPAAITEAWVSSDFLKENNLTSAYATTNIHEWFADGFSAWALRKLGEKGVLVGGWQSHLIVLPQTRKEYWVNYGNLSDRFASWLDQRCGISP